jgi:SIR2-like domain
VINLCNLIPDLSNTSPIGIKCSRNAEPSTTYSVVTLNYDVVLESICSFLNSGGFEGDTIQFNTDGTANSWPTLAKLHGSIDSEVIIPPTWSKGTHPEIVPVWQMALHALRRANHLRIIGYSLPVADSYVRYLLKAAALSTPHLKQIDILCLDPGGKVRSQYNEFIEFPNYRFVSMGTEEYLE